MNWRVSSIEDAQQEALRRLRSGHSYAEELSSADSRAAVVWLLAPPTVPAPPKRCLADAEDGCE